MSGAAGHRFLPAPSSGLQRQFQIGNQVIGMLDADRQADRRFQHADPLPYFGGHTGMRHRGRMARKRFRAAQADGELEDLQRVQEFERGRLAAADIEGEGRAGAAALGGEGAARWRFRIVVRQVMNLLDLRVMSQEIGDGPRIAVCPLHAQLQRLERPAEHPAGMRIELRADRPAQRLDLLDHGLAAENGAGDEIGMAADIFGQRIERDIGAMLDRPLEYRPEQGVVADDDGRVPLLCADRIGHTPDHRDVDQAVGRIGRCLDQDDGNAALGDRLVGGLLHRAFADAIGKADGGDAEIEEGLRQQGFRAAVERLRMQDRITRPDEGEQGRGDRRHARGKQRPAFRPLIDGKPVLDDLAVGMVEARINEAGAFARRRLAPAGDIVEEIAPVLGRIEDEGGGEEHRRLDRPFREFGIVAVVQHLRFGMQSVIADMGFGRMRGGHDRLLYRACRGIRYIKITSGEQSSTMLLGGQFTVSPKVSAT
ncbi:hypothetical protein RHECNPAF_14110012 [Rhizobium etli CNPAF512]|nr:hypothetical protein RHECNPAF_14110012 [Rhizobium etli CNPAF512]